jgi:hypothetical protein
MPSSTSLLFELEKCNHCYKYVEECILIFGYAGDLLVTFDLFLLRFEVHVRHSEIKKHWNCKLK